jgi:hypothetical protein
MILNMMMNDWRLFRARRAAKKYNLDFVKTCVFPEQVKHVQQGDTVEIEMESGKTGLYQVSIKFSCYGTGQRDYHYKFVGYK